MDAANTRPATLDWAAIRAEGDAVAAKVAAARAGATVECGGRIGGHICTVQVVLINGRWREAHNHASHSCRAPR